MRAPHVLTLTALLSLGCAKYERTTPVAATAAAVADRRTSVRAAAPSPLDACQKTTAHPGEVEFRCARFQATVLGPQLGNLERSPLAVLEAHARLDPRITVERVRLALAGAERDSLRVRFMDPSGATATITTVAVPAAYPGTVRVIRCATLVAGGCDGVLDALAAHARTDTSAPAPTVKTGPPSFAGRVLVLPKGCEQVVDGPRTCLRCGGGPSVCYSVAAPDTEAGIDWLFEPEKAILRTHGPLVEATRACRIGGAKATCRTAEVTRADGRQLATILSSARVGGARYIVHCNLVAALRRPLPPPCGNVIELE